MRITKTIHTVDLPGGRIVAGFQVRGGGALLGLLWFMDGEWHWRAEGAPYFGTRATMGAAITVLVDTYQFRTGGRALPRVIVDDEARPAAPVVFSRPAAAPAPAPRPAPRPAPPARSIVWGDEGDGDALTAALGAALDRQQKR